MDLEDKFAIAEVIQAWGVYRDQGKWDELRVNLYVRRPHFHLLVSRAVRVNSSTIARRMLQPATPGRGIIYSRRA